MTYLVKALYRRRPQKGSLCGPIIFHAVISGTHSIRSALDLFDKSEHKTSNGWTMRPHRIRVTSVAECP